MAMSLHPNPPPATVDRARLLLFHFNGDEYFGPRGWRLAIAEAETLSLLAIAVDSHRRRNGRRRWILRSLHHQLPRDRSTGDERVPGAAARTPAPLALTTAWSWVGPWCVSAAIVTRTSGTHPTRRPQAGDLVGRRDRGGLVSFPDRSETNAVRPGRLDGGGPQR